jgi:hypothetical protein
LVHGDPGVAFLQQLEAHVETTDHKLRGYLILDGLPGPDEPVSTIEVTRRHKRGNAPPFACESAV